VFAGILDCFATLAMTVIARSEATKQSRKHQYKNTLDLLIHHVVNTKYITPKTENLK